MKSKLVLMTSTIMTIGLLTGCGTEHIHNFGRATYTWSKDYSTCTATRVCLDDESHNETETQNSRYGVMKNAKCEEEGTGRYTVVFSNDAFETQIHDVTLDPTGHNWGTPAYDWNTDFSQCTATRICLNDSTHIEEETADSTYQEITPATEEAEGLGRYTTTFVNEAFETQTHDVTLDRLEPILDDNVPILSEDGKTIKYGLYPQTVIDDSSLVSTLDALTTPESNGWYLYDNEYYAKLEATPYKSDYVFDNGTTIESGTTYWFKCEPITWNVLYNNNGEYYILSSVLLDAHCYDENSSNYENSEIRAWLNSDFYNSAFALNDSYIQTTVVGNGASTTNSTSNPYACNNTFDKVFLPSYQDYLNPDYGFSSSTGSTDTRCCKTTDWARARGAYYKTNSSYLYNGYYWTRSPYSGGGALYVEYDGILHDLYANSTFHCVRPSVSLRIA